MFIRTNYSHTILNEGTSYFEYLKWMNTLNANLFYLEFWSTNIHLMCAPEGKVSFVFLRVSIVIQQGKKNHFYDNCILRHDNKQ